MDDEDVDVYFAKHDIQSVVSDILCFGRIGTRLGCWKVALIHVREPWRKNILSIIYYTMYTIMIIMITMQLYIHVYHYFFSGPWTENSKAFGFTTCPSWSPRGMSWATIDPRNWVPSWPITSNVVLGKPPRSAVRQKGGGEEGRGMDPLQVAWASGLGVLEKNCGRYSL